MEFKFSEKGIKKEKTSLEIPEGGLVLIETTRGYPILGQVSSLKEDNSNSELYFKSAYTLDKVSVFGSDYLNFSDYTSTKQEDGRHSHSNTSIYGIGGREVRNVIVGKKKILNHLRKDERYKENINSIKKTLENFI